MTCRLDSKDLLGSLRTMERLFDEAGFNDAAKFGMLRSAVMDHLYLAQFAIYRGANSYDDLERAVKDFWVGLQAFQSSAVYASYAAGGLSTDWFRDMGIVPAKKVLLPSNARSANVESKVDALADQLSQLSLLIKKQTTQPGGPPGERTRLCSFCKKEGHAANRCPSNPHLDSMCARCGKKDHAKATCWARVTPDTNRKVGFRGVRSESDTEMKLSPPTAQNGVSNDTGGQVTLVTETIATSPDELVATAKRNAAGQALSKQARTVSMPV